MKIVFSIHVWVCMVICVVLCDDNDSDVKRLCKGDNSIECVRGYFNKNAKCSVIRGDIDEKPMKQTEVLRAYAPKVNLTLLLQEAFFGRLNGTVNAFHINENNKELVMSIHFNNIYIDVKKGSFVISQRSKAPKIVKSWNYAAYDVILTAVIPLDETNKISAETITNSLITAYQPRKYLEFEVGPEILENKDPVVAAVAKGVKENLQTVIDELFLTGSYIFFEAYLEKYICKFGFPYKEAE